MPERRVDPRNFEAMDDEMAEVLRAKTDGERLQIAFRMFSFARRMILSNLRAEHPDWSEEQIRRETARRISHGAV